MLAVSTLSVSPPAMGSVLMVLVGVASGGMFVRTLDHIVYLLPVCAVQRRRITDNEYLCLLYIIHSQGMKHSSKVQV